MCLGSFITDNSGEIPEVGYEVYMTNLSIYENETKLIGLIPTLLLTLRINFDFDFLMFCVDYLQVSDWSSYTFTACF